MDHGLSSLEGVHVQIAPIERAELPADHFDLILLSNFLEHFESPAAVARILTRMRALLRPGGRLIVMGPNFRYSFREYYDCVDHVLPLTHRSVAEHLHGAGPTVNEVVPRFLPYSFRDLASAPAWMIRGYFACPPVFGQQFLVSAIRVDRQT